jgi:excisionase family DNA binding protein
VGRHHRGQAAYGRSAYMLGEQNASTAAPGQEPASLDDNRLTYTLAEAASRLGISTWLAYEAAHRGELPVCRIGRRMLVPRAALLRLLGQDPSSGSESA